MTQDQMIRELDDQAAIQWAGELAETNIDGYFHDGLILFLARRQDPGGFLRALLENNAVSAIHHCDSRSRANIVPILEFLLVRVPLYMWGDAERVKYWLSRDV